MRRTLLLIAVYLSWTFAAAAETLVVNAPNDGFLNLRTGPGSQFAILMEMDHGTRVETLELSGNWARVQHESGAVGWAFRDYLVRAAPLPGRYIVHSPGDGFLNLRTGPGTGFAIVTRMYNGQGVEVLERSGTWVRLYHLPTGLEGWASARYLIR